MLFFFPRGVLGEILNLIESVSGGFPSYFFKFGIEVCNDKLYCEIANRYSPICSSLPFSFFPDFSSKISPQPFKIETSN